MHEVVNTQTCPLCGALHTYRLAVETRPDASTLGKPLRSRRRTFAGAFRCPTRNEEFRGSTTVLAAEGEEIVSINVARVEE